MSPKIRLLVAFSLLLLSSCATGTRNPAHVYIDGFNGQVPPTEIGVIHNGRLYVAPTVAFKYVHIGDDCRIVHHGPRAARSAVVRTKECRPRYSEWPSGEYALKQVILREPRGAPIYLNNTVMFTIKPGMVTSINLPPLQPGACFKIVKANDIEKPVSVRMTHYRRMRVSYLSTFEPPRNTERAVGLSGATCANDRIWPDDALSMESALRHYETFRYTPGFSALPQD